MESAYESTAAAEPYGHCPAPAESPAGDAVSSWRPRGSLARVLYEKELSDRQLDCVNKDEWYECSLEGAPEEIAARFVQLSLDGETERFLASAQEKSEWIFTQIWHSLAKMFLGLFMSQTSINGWLGRGSMFVLSTDQFRKVMKVDDSWRAKSLLDLGAGDGEVTTRLASAFDEVYVTEMSPTMKSVLQRKGYRLLEIEEWQTRQKYDVISCLNLLDRCDRPLQLLQHIRDSLEPDGRLLVALVLPFSQYVEFGRPDHSPTEDLPINGETFQEQAISTFQHLFQPAGFEVVSWSRVPYLCEGDLRQRFYWLDDAIFVLKKSQ